MWETRFKTMEKSVEEKYGKRPTEFVVRKSYHRAPSETRLSAESEFKPQISVNNLSVPKISIDNANHADTSTSDMRMSNITYNTQSSFEAVNPNPFSIAKNFGMNMMGGISRRKSNLGNFNRNDENRNSVNSNTSVNNQNRSLDTLNSFDDSPTASTIIVTEMRPPHHNISRPSSGQHYLLTSTPNRSRSPSMASNRDSMISNDFNESMPPPLPTKREYTNGGDNQSLSNYEITSNHSESREDLYNGRIITVDKKKRPPPPPPINENDGTSPPRRRPPLKPPTDD